jgi:flagellar capping protein FliD
MNISIDISTNTDPLGMNTAPATKSDTQPFDFQAVYQSTLQSLQQMMQQVFAEDGITEAELDGNTGSDMTAQSASGALAGYMHQNGIQSLTPNQLYQMAYNPAAGTPPDVSSAAQFMLQNPDTFNQIETHDVPGADGIAGANDFDWAAQGGLGTVSATPVAVAASDTNAQSASGALAGYMHENGINTLDPDQLYQLAYNPHANTPPGVSAAAAFMLQNSDTFDQIETHDVPGADGIAGANDFDWAAEGGLNEAS